MSGIDSVTWPIEPHTSVKHVILEEYLKAWFPIVSNWSKRILYLDGFAGPGSYSNGEDGSPVIAIRTATQHPLGKNFNEIQFAFIEKDPARAQHLKQILNQKFPSLPSNLQYEVVGSEFAPTLESALDDLEKQGSKLAPTFAFLDPFGFSGLPMKLISRMLSYKTCEVLVTFMSGFVRRFTDEMRAETLNELYGTTEWTDANQLSAAQKQNFLIDLYVRQLKQIGGATYVRTFEMIGENNQTVYHLVYGTKHPKGMEVMKKAMQKADRRGTYRFSDRTDNNQTFLTDLFDNEEWVKLAATNVYERFKGQTVQGESVKIYVITETPFLYKSAILSTLEKSNPPKIAVKDRPRAFTYPNDCTIDFLK